MGPPGNLLDYFAARSPQNAYGTVTGRPWDEQTPGPLIGSAGQPPNGGLVGYDPAEARRQALYGALARAGAEIASAPRGQWVGQGLLGLFGGAEAGKENYEKGLLDNAKWAEWRKNQQKQQSWDVFFGKGTPGQMASLGASDADPQLRAAIAGLNPMEREAVYRMGPDDGWKYILDLQKKHNPVSVAPGSTLYDPDSNKAIFTAPGTPRAPSLDWEYSGDKQRRTQYDEATGTYKPIGPWVPRWSDGQTSQRLTQEQMANNAEIDAARKRLPVNLTLDEIRRRTTSTYDTGMPNPDYDPTLTGTLRTAMQHKIGDDPGFDQVQTMLTGGAPPPGGAGGSDGGGGNPGGPPAPGSSRGASIPLDSRGNIDPKRMMPGGIYDGGDGTRWKWDGSSFTQVP